MKPLWPICFPTVWRVGLLVGSSRFFLPHTPPPSIVFGDEVSSSCSRFAPFRRLGFSSNPNNKSYVTPSSMCSEQFLPVIHCNFTTIFETQIPESNCDVLQQPPDASVQTSFGAVCLEISWAAAAHPSPALHAAALSALHLFMKPMWSVYSEHWPAADFFFFHALHDLFLQSRSCWDAW